MSRSSFLQFLFEIQKLTLESRVRKHNLPSLLHQSQRVKHVHLVLLHEVGNHDGCRARHASVAVHENRATAFERRFDELDAGCEVLCEVLPGHVHRVDHFVL